MSRESTNEYAEDGQLLNGYDYKNQAWVVDGLYQDCGHPPIGTPTPAVGVGSYFPGCNCYGRAHEGEVCITKEETS